MASVIKIKRSAVTSVPTALEEGELAYSELSHVLFVGTNGGADMEVLGGKKFTDLLGAAFGTLTPNSAIITDSNSKIDHLIVDNIDLNGSTIQGTLANTDLNVTAQGTGGVNVSSLKVNGGLRIQSILNENDMASNSATALATQASIKAYVDGVASGLQVKQAARLASTGNVNLASSSNPGPIDGVNLNDGDRVLLKDQTNPVLNGIYNAVDKTNPTTWVRSSDFDEPSEVSAGVFFFVEEGTANADSGWVLTTDNPLVLGTDPLMFTQFSGAGSIGAGDGLDKVGNVLSVNGSEIAGTGLQSAGGAVINVDPDLNLDTLTTTGNVDVGGDVSATNLVVAAGTSLGGNLSAQTATFNDAVTTTSTVDVGGHLSAGSSTLPNLDVSGTVITSVADPSNPSDAANKAYVDAAVLGATIDPSTLAGDGLGTASGQLKVNVDGSTLEIVSDTVRVKNAGITNAKLANSSVTVTAGAALTGGGAVALGASINLDVAVDGTTIEVTADALNVKDLGITNAKLAGGISNAKLTNSSVTVTAGSGLTGGGAVALGGTVNLDVNVDGSTLEIVADTVQVKDLGITNAKLAGSISNAKLANSSVTVTAGAALTGGGAVSLGGTVNLDVAVDGTTLEITADALNVKDGGITNAKLAGGITNAKLANSSIATAGDTGTGIVALGGTLTYHGTNGIAVAASGATVTIDLPTVDGGTF